MPSCQSLTYVQDFSVLVRFRDEDAKSRVRHLFLAPTLRVNFRAWIRWLFFLRTQLQACMKCLSSGVECIQAAFSRKAATDYVGVSVNLFLPPWPRGDRHLFVGACTFNTLVSERRANF
jgi:hypothetical protein